jgi:hypothetical protein
MYRGALRTRSVVGAVVIAAYLLVAITAPSAYAGSIWVTDGNMNAGQTGTCNALADHGDLSAFYVPSACPMSLATDGLVPERPAHVAVVGAQASFQSKG